MNIIQIFDNISSNLFIILFANLNLSSQKQNNTY